MTDSPCSLAIVPDQECREVYGELGSIGERGRTGWRCGERVALLHCLGARIDHPGDG